MENPQLPILGTLSFCVAGPSKVVVVNDVTIGNRTGTWLSESYIPIHSFLSQSDIGFRTYIDSLVR